MFAVVGIRVVMEVMGARNVIPANGRKQKMNISLRKKKNLCVCSRDRTMIDDANQLISLLTIQ